MQAALRIQTTILSGSKIEVSAPQLEPGQQVEIIILVPEPSAPMRRSALDILGEAVGHRAFKTAEDVSKYLDEERSAWDN